MPIDSSIRKVMVIGSGPIVIGQAAEFDYAGAQACRVLHDAGVNVVLVNSNPATIMTDKALADEIYLEPLTLTSVKRIIEKEQPDSLLAGLGGQTGLTLAMELDKEGFLQQHNVRLIGTNAAAIDKAEDRELFKETMAAIGEPTIPSGIANTVAEALEVAHSIGYPVIIRPAFTLGGAGGGVAYSAEELTLVAQTGLDASPITQILVERYIYGRRGGGLPAEDRELFKETMAAIGEPTIPSGIANTVAEALEVAGSIGYPVIIRPAFTLGGAGGGVAYSPEELGLVAQTGLDASPITQILVERYIYGWKEIEFETMRDGAGNVIAVCSMENFDPVGVHTGDSIVVAPALTLSDKEFQMLRSAALNIISALDIVGGCNCQFALDPDSFDYAVIEVNPRVSRSSALASKATGYPIAKITTKIALGYTLDEIQNDITGKTCACFEPALDYVVVKFPKWADCDDHRLFTVFEALCSGVSIDEIHDITRIDRWFLARLQNLVDYEASIQGGLTPELYRRGKYLGYPDAALRRLSGSETLPPFRAGYKMVDTCAAEFDAQTPYFYASADARCEARSFPRSGKPVVMVLGSGPIRIGQGIEFDYSSVHCVWTLKELGYDVVIVNNNPETVSTDYDTADRLYFEPLTAEDVLQIIDVEQPVGVVVAFGGQTAIALTQTLDRHGIRILGTSAEGIDIAEDRERFDALLERFHISRPKGMGVQTLPEALHAAQTLGYPVLLRPSYVIGGQNMKIVHDGAEVTTYMQRILAQGIDNPVLVDKYMMGTELEVDVISDGTDVLIPGIMEHIERAGVHSGDSIAVYPPYNLNDIMTDKIVDSSRKLALALGTKGLVNIQYLIWENELYVIEVNPRASRTVPYISKVTGVPMVDVAARVMLGAPLASLGYGTGLHPIPPYYAVKVPVFSFEKLGDVNAYLGPEMKSTGEVLGLGKTMQEALFKGLTSAGMVVGQHPDGRHGVFVSVDTHDLGEIVSLAKKLDDLHFALYATEETAAAIARLGIDVVTVDGIRESDHAFALLESGCIDYIVYTGALKDATMDDYIALHRRALQLGIPCFTSLDTANALADIISSRYNERNTELVDINHMRTERQSLKFAKMQATGDDYIYVENFDGHITGPESLCIPLCSRHRGIGGYGIVLIEHSDVADAKMRVFNRDGSAGGMGGNAIRCVAKYLYDNGIVPRDDLTIEAGGLVHRLHLYTRFGTAGLVTVDMGKPAFEPANVPVTLPGDRVIDRPVTIAGGEYRITCLSMGNPHCVVFADRVDEVDVAHLGPQFEHADIFPARTNTEFIRVVNRTTIKMRVWERGNGETRACGTGACAAVVAAVENGLCPKGETITVKVSGGDLIVTYDDDGVRLTGNAELAFTGVTTY